MRTLAQLWPATLKGAGYLALAASAAAFCSRIAADFLFRPPPAWNGEDEGLLPGLGALYLPAFGIYLHFWAGVFVTALGLIQILPFFRRGRWARVHRTSGALYCGCAALAAVGGNVFIYSNGTSGGPNMSAAFSLYGWLLGGAAVAAYATAGSTAHPEWALRAWVLGYCSLLYRVIYFVLTGLGYPMRPRGDGRGVVGAWLRPLDAAVDWAFFVLPLAGLELYLWARRRRAAAEYAPIVANV